SGSAHVNGFFHETAEAWTIRGKPRDPSTGPGGPAHRSPERAADDIDDLVDVLVGLALLGGGPDATTDVVLEDHDRQRIDGGPQRSGLLQDVDAVFLALDHPGDPTDLALHPRQAPDQLGFVLGIAVPEVGRGGLRGRGSTGRAGGHRAWLRS